MPLDSIWKAVKSPCTSFLIMLFTSLAKKLASLVESLAMSLAMLVIGDQWLDVLDEGWELSEMVLEELENRSC